MVDKINFDETINKAVKEAAKEMIQELRNSNYIKKEISYFRKVEILLYNYNKLKSAVKQKDEDIEYIEQNGLPQRSGSIIMYKSSGGGNISSEERYMQLIEKYKLEKLETERDIRRIENALSKIKNDKYYEIIKLKYISEEKSSDEEIAEVLSKDQSTITRNRKRLINSIKVILFPESIKDFA